MLNFKKNKQCLNNHGGILLLIMIFGALSIFLAFFFISLVSQKRNEIQSEMAKLEFHLVTEQIKNFIGINSLCTSALQGIVPSSVINQQNEVSLNIPLQGAPVLQQNSKILSLHFDSLKLATLSIISSSQIHLDLILQAHTTNSSLIMKRSIPLIANIDSSNGTIVSCSTFSMKSESQAMVCSGANEYVKGMMANGQLICGSI